MIKISYNSEWRNRKICHLISVIRQREVLNTQSSNSEARKTFHYASHAWSLPTGRHSLIAGNQIRRLQKQIKSPNCSRQYTENEIKLLGINFFWGIHRFCVISEFALAGGMGRKKRKDPWEVGASFSPTAIQRHTELSKESALSPGSTPKHWNTLKMPQITVWMSWWANWRWGPEGVR